jgi:hypothetical protein
VAEPDFTVELDGELIGFRDMTRGQLVMINRLLKDAQRIARKEGAGAASMNLLGQVFDVIESTIITEEDREHVLRAMLYGKIDLEEAYLILRKGQPEPGPDDADVEVKRPVTAKSRAKK